MELCCPQLIRSPYRVYCSHLMHNFFFMDYSILLCFFFLFLLEFFCVFHLCYIGVKINAFSFLFIFTYFLL